MRKGWLGATAIATIFSASAAWGQTAPANGGADIARAPAADDQGAKDSDIVVTGSRLNQTVLTSVAPVSQVSSVAIEQSGQRNIATVLSDLPQIGVGVTGANSERDFSGLAGVNFVDLRNLDSKRTLVLINGRRQVAGSQFTAAVDLNTIPADLVDRVEVVTGGTSAVYGADAVSGVINIILKKNFEGVEARARGGITSRGDGESYGASLLAGQNFADGRGNITLNASYDDVKGVSAEARSWGVSGVNTISNPANTGNNDGIPNFITRPNIRFVGPTQLGYTGGGAFPLFIFTADGQGFRPYDLGSIGNRSGRAIGGDGGFFEKYDTLSTPTRRWSLNGNLTYEVTPGISFFFEGRYTNTRVRSQWQPVADDFVYAAPLIAASNPYVPASFRALLTASGVPAFPFYRVYEDFGRRGSVNDRTQQQYTAGFDGKLGGSWKFNVFAGYGSTVNSSIIENLRDETKFLQSTNVTLIGGQPACADATARAQGCQPLNVFNPSSTPAGIAYSRVNDTYYARTTLRMAGGSVTGNIFNLPAGPVETALGVEAREATAMTQPGAGLQSGNLFEGPEIPVSGNIKVKEAFGELRVPILKDMGIRELSLQAAGRVSDYNNNGTQYSWNVGGIFSPVDGVRFRAMRSRSVRAPDIAELFSPLQVDYEFVQDPCDASVRNQAANRNANCLALGIPNNFNAPTNGRTTPGQVGGNRNLDPEVANTWTVGLVLTPRFLPGFSATIDYFDINIRDAIDSTPFSTILNNCVDQPIAPASNPLCALITRSTTTGEVTNIVATVSNIGRLKTRGVDFELAYASGLRGIGLPGRINLDLKGTYTARLRQITNANDPTSENILEGYRGNPQWELNASATYSLPGFSVTWRSHFLSSTSILLSENVAAPVPKDQFDLPFTGSEVYNDLSVAFDITKRIGVRLNVNNIFDNKPPNRAFNIHQGIYKAAIYPNLGTTFAGELKVRF
jgi:outer membrane receptor protein involved in Fe transport